MKKKRKQYKPKDFEGHVKVDVHLNDAELIGISANPDAFRQHLIEKYAYAVWEQTGKLLDIYDLAFLLHVHDPNIIQEDIEIIEREKGVLLPINGPKWKALHKKYGKKREN